MRHLMTNPMRGSKGDTGATLIVAMLVLVVISLLGIYSIETSRVEVQIAGNERTYRQTFYTAESGWHVAVNWLDSVYPAITESMDTTDMAKYLSGDPDDARTWIAMSGNNQLEYAVDLQLAGTSHVPGYSSDFKQYNYVINSTGRYADQSEAQIDVGAGKVFYVGGY